ncbi:hypothetical protein INR49_008157 [Caranx melampygus]|nr:hypothetical protein INR49_008157 [Caranx melampygus]
MNVRQKNVSSSSSNFLCLNLHLLHSETFQAQRRIIWAISEATFFSGSGRPENEDALSVSFPRVLDFTVTQLVVKLLVPSHDFSIKVPSRLHKPIIELCFSWVFKSHLALHRDTVALHQHFFFDDIFVFMSHNKPITARSVNHRGNLPAAPGGGASTKDPESLVSDSRSQNCRSVFHLNVTVETIRGFSN